MLGRLRKPFWGALALSAGVILVYALIAPQRSKISDLEIRGRIERYSPGDEVPRDVASRAPEKAVASFGPPRPTGLPFRSKGRAQPKEWLELPDLQRAKRVKRGKRPEERSLRYRFRVEKGWEIYRVPRVFREKYTNTREALTLAREAAGRSATTSSGKDGFRITSIERGSLLEEVGIRPGDVIVSVNGRPVTGPDDGRRLYADLKHEEKIWVVVDRDGEIVNLYYELEA